MGRRHVYFILFLACIILPALRGATCRWARSFSAGSACYLYNTTLLSYVDAKSACISNGGVLAPVKTSDQISAYEAVLPVIRPDLGVLATAIWRRIYMAPNGSYVVPASLNISSLTVEEFISTLLFKDQPGTALPTYVWVGANDIVNNGTWVWEEDEKVATELTDWWASDQPSNGEGEDCATIVAPARTSRAIYDDVCDNLHTFICMEKDLPTTPDATTKMTTNAISTTTSTVKVPIAACNKNGASYVDFNLVLFLHVCAFVTLVM